MQDRPYEIGLVTEQTSENEPTHVKVKIHNVALMPALLQFAVDEGVTVIHAPNGEDHEYWLDYEDGGVLMRLAVHLAHGYLQATQSMQ